MTRELNPELVKQLQALSEEHDIPYEELERMARRALKDPDLMKEIERVGREIERLEREEGY
jgi:uncharacterized protein with von Willebrand factor type A (vWA) domain